jgi:hypothetical protein
MVTETCTHSDILHLFGPIADHLAREILDLQPPRTSWKSPQRMGPD